MTRWELPQLSAISEKVRRGVPLSALETFIFEETPAQQWEWAFRESLHAAIMDAMVQMFNAHDPEL